MFRSDKKIYLMKYQKIPKKGHSIPLDNTKRTVISINFAFYQTNHCLNHYQWFL